MRSAGLAAFLYVGQQDLDLGPDGLERRVADEAGAGRPFLIGNSCALTHSPSRSIFRSGGYSKRHKPACLPDGDRAMHVGQFLAGERAILVSTQRATLGIDCPNVCLAVGKDNSLVSKSDGFSQIQIATTGV